MRKLGKTLIAASAVAGLIAGAVATPATARRASNPLKGEGEGLKLIANVPWEGGTDMEFATIKGHDYAFAGSAPGIAGSKIGAFHVVNIDNPEKPKEVATLNCSLYQADIQISHDKKTAFMAADQAGGPDSCQAVGKEGFLSIDIRNPLKPKAIGFGETGSSHNLTVHPKKPFLYNSSSKLAGGPEIQIWDIKNPAKPVKLGTFPSLPHAPHDISFNADGTRAVTAAISHIDVFDTTDPTKPVLLFSTQCPGCSITHDAKFTPDGKHVVVGDEGGGGGGYPCPGGALYFYDVVGDRALALRGVYEPDEFVFARDGQTGLGACTSHVFDISDDGTKVAISWYSAGTRYLDISDPSGVAVGGNSTGGVKELGWFMPDGGISWSSKFFKGPYIYSNDEVRGFDVFKIVKS